MTLDTSPTAAELVKARYISAGLADSRSFEGCSLEEICSVEKKFSVHLPGSYRSFLALMGRCAGPFLEGSDYSFPDLLTFREYAEKFLAECGTAFRLMPSHFVFMIHQGYIIWFFDCANEQDDPKVIAISETQAEPIQEQSFSAWLLLVADQELAMARELSDNGS
jgi:hypothetical protein